MKKALTCIHILVLLASTNATWAQSKVYISAAMEGVTGAVTGEQLGPSVRTCSSTASRSTCSSSGPGCGLSV